MGRESRGNCLHEKDGGIDTRILSTDRRKISFLWLTPVTGTESL